MISDMMADMMTFSFFVLTLITTAAGHNVTSGSSCRNVVYNVQKLIQQVIIIWFVISLIHFQFIIVYASAQLAYKPIL